MLATHTHTLCSAAMRAERARQDREKEEKKKQTQNRASIDENKEQEQLSEQTKQLMRRLQLIAKHSKQNDM